MQIVLEVCRLSSLLPRDEKYGLKVQLQRAAVSIPSNIAEGCGRESDRDFKRFLHIAMGSAFELETQLILTHHLELIPRTNFDRMLALLSEEEKMINTFISAVKNRKPNTQPPKRGD